MHAILTDRHSFLVSAIPQIWKRINDLENNSCERRRSPFAHSIYGVATTINAANYGYFLALEMANDLGHSNVIIAR